MNKKKIKRAKIIGGKISRVSDSPTGSERCEMSALELRLRQNARLRPPLPLSASGQADKTRRRRNRRDRQRLMLSPVRTHLKVVIALW